MDSENTLIKCSQPTTPAGAAAACFPRPCSRAFRPSSDHLQPPSTVTRTSWPPPPSPESRSASPSSSWAEPPRSKPTTSPAPAPPSPKPPQATEEPNPTSLSSLYVPAVRLSRGGTLTLTRDRVIAGGVQQPVCDGELPQVRRDDRLRSGAGEGELQYRGECVGQRQGAE